MKRGKDEEKIMGPMFPRLHVNDTEKGGPRAPPRNKMALYEQLSIPSQRFNHVVPPSSQGGGNDRAMFFSRQVHPRYPSEKQYSQYSEVSTPLPQVVEQRKKLDEDDYRVPIFIHSVPTDFDKYSNDMNWDKTSPSNPPYMLQKIKETGVLGNSRKQEGKYKNGENSNEFVVGWESTVSSLSHEPGNNLANSIIERLRADDSGEPELCAESRLPSDTAKRNSSNSWEDLPSEDRDIIHGLSDNTGSLEDGSCRPPQTGNLERGDSVSETSILDTVSSPDMTPDDVAGIIGLKSFWKARRAIMNQQRIFAVQVFELHRLVKVQKLIAASPHLMSEDSAYIDKPIKALIGKKRPLDHSIKASSNNSKKKGDLENPGHKKEASAENTVEKVASMGGNDHGTGMTCFSQSQMHHWLIPVMSPTEGLVYKPYPGSNPMIGPPAYGIPGPPAQYPFPMFGPHGYFPPYSMPIMTPAGSSVEPTPSSGRRSTWPASATAKNGPSLGVGEEVEVQGSTGSSPTERQRGRGGGSVRLFPTSPAMEASNECSSRVIKVMPRNGISASESAARIFRSIQEERKQYDSV